MRKRIAVETLTLSEVADIFKQSLEIVFPRSRGAISETMKKLNKSKVSNHKWVKTYEIFPPSKFNFYCQKIGNQSNPIVSIGMTHRTSKGMILVALDVSNGGITTEKYLTSKWDKWIRVYTSHFCERYAERIMNTETNTFEIGSNGIMFSDIMGPVRVTDTIAEGLDKIEFQFKEGQAYGYRDSSNKIVFLKTVYSNNMLKGDRLKFQEEWEEPLSQLYKLFRST